MSEIERIEVALIVDGGDGDVPLMVSADSDATVGQLLKTVGSWVGRADDAAPWRLKRGYVNLDRSATVGSLQLRHGDHLLSPSAPRPSGVARSQWQLRIVGGPDTGHLFPLPPGTTTLGRDGAAICLADPFLSSVHARFDVTADGVVVADAGSTNGTLVDRQVIGAEAVPFRPGMLAEVGGSLLAVEPVSDSGQAPPPYRSGRLLFNRPPRVLSSDAEPVVVLPPPPEPPSKRRIPMATALIPLVMGLVIAKVAHNPLYLAFAVLSPVMILASVIGDRRSGRTDYRQALSDYRARFERATQLASELAASSVADRRKASPDPAELAVRARRTDARLWERRMADTDFLSLRVGMADQPTRVRFEGGEPRTPPLPGSPPSVAEQLRQAHAFDRDVPVVVPLATDTIGVVGDEAAREALVRALLLQAACLHSPRDLAIVALVPKEDLDRWQFLPWLPHTETLLTGARTVAYEQDHCQGLLAAVDDVVAQRRGQADQGFGSGRRRFGLHILLLLAGEVPVQRAVLSRLLAAGPLVGVTAIIVADRHEELPGECTFVASFKSGGTALAGSALSLVATGTGQTIRPVIPDLVAGTVLSEAAFALASLRDITALGGGADLPSRANLLELLDLVEPTGREVAARWARSAGGLGAVVGVSGVGPHPLDLRRDGPHALVAGTTGAGKSELLQTWVASLAAAHPPHRLNFVLVDYKGGAAFKDCVKLPHVVGFFTDLDGHLAERALESLNAELRRREEILRQSGTKDLVELEERAAGRAPAVHAPASLAIVFDEFAFLKKEVPEFVDGVVDIAQRGRSLGVHLVLATQRPAGVVDDKIRGNVTLRIALRVSDDADSTDVLGRPDAARIPKSIPGRALLSVGHGEVTALQAAYVGGQRPVRDRQPQVSARPFLFNPLAAPRATEPPAPADAPTDLQRLVAAISEAATLAGEAPQPHPWLDPLALSYPLAAQQQRAAVRAGTLATVVGVVDEPSLQRQRPFVLDLTAEGHVLAFGASGAGKTTLLRTIAAGLAGQLGPDDLHLYGLDFATRGLLALNALPQCGGVVEGDDTERVERLFSMLDQLVIERQAAIGRSDAGSFVEFRERASGGAPWVVVLLDGYAGFFDAFNGIDHGDLVDRLARLAAEGRGVGLHLIITADRRGGLPSSLTGVVAGRVALRMADPDEYSWLGVAKAAKDAVLPPGRGFLADSTELHLCCVGEDPAGKAQAAALQALGRELSRQGGSAVPPVEVLPNDVPVSALPVVAGGSRSVPVGIEGSQMAPASVALDEVPTFLVCGPDGSGRSTALATLVTGLRKANPDLAFHLLAPRRTALTSLVGWTSVARGVDRCQEAAGRLAAEALTRADGSGPPLVVIIDDGDELVDGVASSSLDLLVRRARDGGAVVGAACLTHVAHRAFTGWLMDMRKAKHGLLLQPDPEVDGDLFSSKMPRKSNRPFPPGRGYLVRRAGLALVQIAR